MKALIAAARVTGVALAGLGALLLLIAAAASVNAAYVYVGERCWGETQFHCDSSTPDKVFVVGQMIWGLGAAGFGLVCCANVVRRLAAGERTERLGRHSLIAFGSTLAWFLGPYLIILIANT